MAPILPPGARGSRRQSDWFPAFCLVMGMLLGVLGSRLFAAGTTALPDHPVHPAAAVAGGLAAAPDTRPRAITLGGGAAPLAAEEPLIAAQPPPPPAAAAAAAPGALRRAYAFYAAENNYMCSALANVHRLRGAGADAAIAFVIILPDNFTPTPAHAEAARKLGAELVRVPPLLGPTLSGYYRDCMAKLYVFNLTQFDRVVFMDADSVVLKPMDAFFALPDGADLAAPRAYWLNPGALREGCGSDSWKAADGPQVGLQMKFTSAVMAVAPSARLWGRLFTKYFPQGRAPALKPGYFDMDLLNVEFKDEVSLLRGEAIIALTGHWVVAGRDGVPSSFQGRISQDALWEMTHVVHFSPLKPWMGGSSLRTQRPGSHPRYYEAFDLWAAASEAACH